MTVDVASGDADDGGGHPAAMQVYGPGVGAAAAAHRQLDLDLLFLGHLRHQAHQLAIGDGCRVVEADLRPLPQYRLRDLESR